MKDLTEQVRAETFNRLALDDDSVRSKIVGGEISDEDLIGAAASRAAEVVKRHRSALAAHVSALQAVAESVRRVVEANRDGRTPNAADLALLPKGSVAACG